MNKTTNEKRERLVRSSAVLRRHFLCVLDWACECSGSLPGELFTGNIKRQQVSSARLALTVVLMRTIRATGDKRNPYAVTETAGPDDGVSTPILGDLLGVNHSTVVLTRQRARFHEKQNPGHDALMVASFWAYTHALERAAAEAVHDV